MKFKVIYQTELISQSDIWKKEPVVTKEDIAYIYIEDRDLWTTKEVRQIEQIVWHFRRNFASPSPDRDKTIEFRSVDHLTFLKK